MYWQTVSGYTTARDMVFLYPPYLLQDVARHLALSQQRVILAKPLSIPAVMSASSFAGSAGRPVNEVHVHGGFLAEQGGPVVDVDMSAVPDPATRKRATIMR
jgi:hypothetical protein